MLEILIVCKNCEILNAPQLCIPFFQAADDGQKFLVMDFIVAFGWRILP
jgi:hypothetical protein